LSPPGRFSDKVLEEYCSPYGLETLYDPEGYAKIEGDCGDTIEVFLKRDRDGGLIMAYRTDGCAPTIACCSMLSRMVRGRNPKAAEAITKEELIDALGGLPEDHLHCAELALSTFFKALLDMQLRTGTS
jgi:nitrogen fixation protein NifU and related proteins